MRLRQIHPQNYGDSTKISAEFENVMRYLNAAEYGNKTLAELLAILFNDSGEFDGPIEIRWDSDAGLQYRIGEYDNETTGWTTLVDYETLRGPAGVDVGEVGEPLVTGRDTQTATASQTDFDYPHDETDDLLVYLDGVLQQEGLSNDYTNDPTAGTGGLGQVSFNAAMSGGEIVDFFRIRATAITNYQRTDIYTTATQSVFAFVHDDVASVMVFKNGLLQREGGANDYTAQPSSDTITFNSPVSAGNLITMVTVENSSGGQLVTGFMLEDRYVDPSSGLINFAKLKVADDEIPQAKVSNLVSELAEKPKLTISASAPVGPSQGDLWLDTSSNPSKLKFYADAQWNLTAPDSTLPTFTPSDATKVVKVNGTGTALEYGTVDLSSKISVTARGAANGVASLDSNGRLPESQLPEVINSGSFYMILASPSDGTYDFERAYGTTIRITGISAFTASGTVTAQISVDGVAVGDTYAVSSVATEQALSSPIEVDCTSSSRAIQIELTSSSAPADLEITLAYSVLS